MNSNKIITVFILLFSTHLFAINFYAQIDSAKIAYEKGNYTKAIYFYESIIANNLESSSLYYNLGNAYFKNNDIGMAILNYEKAKKINATDEDLITNLKIANQRIEDKINPTPELFLNQWKNKIVSLMNEKQWSLFLIVLFIFTLCLLALYLTSFNKTWRQIGFFGAIVFLIFSIATYFIASEKHNETSSFNEGIIISPSSNVNSSPSEKGTKLFILHEGTKVKINEESGSWTEIKIANDNIGWIKTSSLKKI